MAANERLVGAEIVTDAEQRVAGALAADAAFAAQLSNLVESAGGDYKAQVIGGGAIAQGDGAKAVGQGGVMIEGFGR